MFTGSEDEDVYILGGGDVHYSNTSSHKDIRLSKYLNSISFFILIEFIVATLVNKII